MFWAATITRFFAIFTSNKIQQKIDQIWKQYVSISVFIVSQRWWELGERESYLSLSITLASLMSYDHFNLGCLRALVVISMMTMFSPLFLRCVKLYVKADKKRKDGSSMNSVTDMSEQNMKKKYYVPTYEHSKA